MKPSSTIRILVVDDEAAVRDAYRDLLGASDQPETSEVARLGARLFGKSTDERSASTTFDVEAADGAEAGVAAVRASLIARNSFDVVFMDMRMPPGRDGAWASAAIRELDPHVDIVIATAYSDADPREISKRIPPEDKLFYLQKPFHAHEVRQLAIALGGKARAEAQLRKLAYFDSLTGLANRVHVRRQMQDAMVAAKSNGTSTAAMFVDLDNFKRINDTLGHHAGDRVLKETATRLRGVVDRAVAVGAPLGGLGCLGGDEFVVFLPEITSREHAAQTARDIDRELSVPIRVDEHDLFVAPSIGIAIYPDDGADVEALLRHSNLAMHFSKRNARGPFSWYTKEMNATALRKLQIENQLRGAIERGEFSLHYQPQLELSSGHVNSMEALLRWNNAELGNVPPLEFIELAEASGQIHEIGNWVLKTACNQASGWIASGLPLERIAVNVSAVQLMHADFMDHVLDALEQSGLAPRALELEITETALIADLDRASEKLAQLKQLDIQIAIDDFGVGYSNVNQLKHLEVDRVKIDRCFVTDIETSERDRTIASAIIAMARGMNLRVTAEGIEDDGQFDVLEAAGCDDIQGYLISRPMSADRASEYLRAHFESRDKDA